MHSWISFLVTGPEENLMAWQWDAMGLVELFDRRGQTVRCRAHAGPPFMDFQAWQKEIDEGKHKAMRIDDPHALERAEKLLTECVELAKEHDVTVQKLEYKDGVESYPVLHLGTHKMKWGK